MPQLDKTTFLSQFLWLLFFYIGFYLVILKHFLPRLSRILKVRQKKVSLSQQGTSALLQEREKVEESLNALVEQGVRVSKGLFQENLQATQEWSTQALTNSNRTTLKDANQSYVMTLGEKTISQNVAVDITFPTISRKGFALALTERIKRFNLSQV
jgi:type IV secretory pathway VirB6-like protein